jgi:hypothetical protein
MYLTFFSLYRGGGRQDSPITSVIHIKTKVNNDNNCFPSVGPEGHGAHPMNPVPPKNNDGICFVVCAADGQYGEGLARTARTTGGAASERTGRLRRADGSFCNTEFIKTTQRNTTRNETFTANVVLSGVVLTRITKNDRTCCVCS